MGGSDCPVSEEIVVNIVLWRTSHAVSVKTVTAFGCWESSCSFETLIQKLVNYASLERFPAINSDHFKFHFCLNNKCTLSKILTKIEQILMSCCAEMILKYGSATSECPEQNLLGTFR